ncbi:3-methyl-2-oxobutanoate hydroxymethyltransferase [Paracoccus tegillarcae]|uniref:3-methyl-2-oxobutanoate hydroxymethyltransferase n=1 Tax=Paracoccus tegillarcae TaxID=1529068 RepID=A0A2K9EHE4_9RHOB|nr:3-methyl-2-oxobutanoate hydroxymethyltransferase [Paracoccus tegillarcae]AUH33749.1 3-methyl-2-oxobutanoate hydroxymethyltransferase [Paracoccus tegillarcae]
MSVTGKIKRQTAVEIRNRKGSDPLVCLTAYTTPVARLTDAHCDVLLVGDSLGMVVYGFDSTLPVTLDMMIRHGQAVMRGSQQALVVVDLPFGSYEAGPQAAFDAAAQVMSETGAGAVKLEGGVAMARTIEFLTARGIPVMAHVGLTPQAVNAFGGYSVQGRGAAAQKVMDDAVATARAGAFAVVLEKIPAVLADRITEEINVPTIGIGASAGCDGQILVVDDMLGLFTDFRPKFVQRYGELGEAADKAIADYAADVRARRFPGPEHVFGDEAPKPKG